METIHAFQCLFFVKTRCTKPIGITQSAYVDFKQVFTTFISLVSMPEELLYFCNVVDGFAPAVCHVCASCFDRLAGSYSAIKLLQRPCTCMFFDHSFLMVARVGSESAVFLPYMDRFTFMFRCCFAFLCAFSSAQFLFYLYPAQFERDGVLSLWYSSVASKTLPDIIRISTFSSFSGGHGGRSSGCRNFNRMEIFRSVKNL